MASLTSIFFFSMARFGMMARLNFPMKSAMDTFGFPSTYPPPAPGGDLSNMPPPLCVCD